MLPSRGAIQVTLEETGTATRVSTGQWKSNQTQSGANSGSNNNNNSQVVRIMRRPKPVAPPDNGNCNNNSKAELLNSNSTTMAPKLERTFLLNQSDIDHQKKARTNSRNVFIEGLLNERKERPTQPTTTIAQGLILSQGSSSNQETTLFNQITQSGSSSEMGNQIRMTTNAPQKQNPWFNQTLKFNTNDAKQPQTTTTTLPPNNQGAFRNGQQNVCNSSNKKFSKTYRERVDDYAKARLRILGSAFPDDDDLLLSNCTDVNRILNSDSNNPSNTEQTSREFASPTTSCNGGGSIKSHYISDTKS